MAHIPIEKKSTNWLGWMLALIGFVLLGFLAADLLGGGDTAQQINATATDNAEVYDDSYTREPVVVDNRG